MSLFGAIVEFSPERLLEPGVITGLVLMVVGLITVLGSGIIADALPVVEEKREFWRNVVRMAGAVLLLAGGITAVLCA